MADKTKVTKAKTVKSEIAREPKRAHKANHNIGEYEMIKVRVPVEIATELRRLSDEDGTSVSEVVRKFLSVATSSSFAAVQKTQSVLSDDDKKSLLAFVNESSNLRTAINRLGTLLNQSQRQRNAAIKSIKDDMAKYEKALSKLQEEYKVGKSVWTNEATVIKKKNEIAAVQKKCNQFKQQLVDVQSKASLDNTTWKSFEAERIKLDKMLKKTAHVLYPNLKI